MNPLDTWVPPEGYIYRSTVKPTQVDTGHIFEDPGQDSHVRHPTEKAQRGLPSQRATATPSAIPPEIIPRELPHTRRTGLWDHAGHQGGTYWRLRPNDSDGDQYFWLGVLLQHDGIRRGVLESDHNGAQRRTGGGRHDCPGATLGMEHKVDALSRAKSGELRGRPWKTHPAHQSIPPPPPPTPWSTYWTWMRHWHNSITMIP